MRNVLAWTLLTALLLPLFVGGVAAIVVTDVGAKAQRILILGNQATQTTQLIDQLTELRAQAQHLKDASMGQIQALTQPFTQLASETTSLVSDGMGWRSDFAGIPGRLAGGLRDMGASGTSMTGTWRNLLQGADTVNQADLAGLAANQTADVGVRARAGWDLARERAEQRLVFTHGVADAAALLTQAMNDARDAYQTVQGQTNLSDTALKQAQVTADVTDGNLTIALAQLAAFQAAQETAKEYAAEQHRRRLNDAWMADQQAAQGELQDRLSAIQADAPAARRRLQLGVHSAFGSSLPDY